MKLDEFGKINAWYEKLDRRFELNE